MKTLRLVVIDADVLTAGRESPAAVSSKLGAIVDPADEFVVPMLEQSATLLASKPRGPEWGCFLAVDEAVGRVVGFCGFKDGPAADGSVEVAYFTFPAFEGRGYASAMAAELLARAGRRRVIAHTLPERNASCRVLEKAGFVLVGDVVDPEDGPVWQWGAEVVKSSTIPSATDLGFPAPA